jgi:hypothetical protein
VDAVSLACAAADDIEKITASNFAHCPAVNQRRKRRVALASAVSLPDRAGTRRISSPAQEAQQKVHRYRLAANQTWEKQTLFGVRIKGACFGGLACDGSDCSCCELTGPHQNTKV